MPIATITPQTRLQSLESLERLTGSSTAFISQFLNDASRKESQVSQNLQTNQAQAIQTQQDVIAQDFAEKTNRQNRLEFLAKFAQENDQFDRTFGFDTRKQDEVERSNLANESHREKVLGETTRVNKEKEGLAEKEFDLDKAESDASVKAVNAGVTDAAARTKIAEDTAKVRDAEQKRLQKKADNAKTQEDRDRFNTQLDSRFSTTDIKLINTAETSEDLDAIDVSRYKTPEARVEIAKAIEQKRNALNGSQPTAGATFDVKALSPVDQAKFKGAEKRVANGEPIPTSDGVEGDIDLMNRLSGQSTGGGVDPKTGGEDDVLSAPSASVVPNVDVIKAKPEVERSEDEVKQLEVFEQQESNFRIGNEEFIRKEIIDATTEEVLGSRKDGGSVTRPLNEVEIGNKIHEKAKQEVASIDGSITIREIEIVEKKNPDERTPDEQRLMDRIKRTSNQLYKVMDQLTSESEKAKQARREKILNNPF